MNTTACRLCREQAQRVFTATVLGQFEVAYYQCPRCALVQTEHPYWLNQAYQQPIGDQDTWQIERSIYCAILVESILPALGGTTKRVVDYGAGYGTLVRLLRNRGIEAYWSDRYAENLFAKEFTWQGDRVDLVTCFEVAEHFVHPLEEFERLFSIAPTVLLSTVLIPSPPPSPSEWDYYALDGGQHIALYSRQTLHYLAEQFGAHLYSNGMNFHLLSTQPLNLDHLSTLDAWKAFITRIERTFAPTIGEPSLRPIAIPASMDAQRPCIGIALFHGLGDIVNATIIARQIKADYPSAHVVWFTSERYACALENNPDIDEVVALPGDPRELDSQRERLRASRQWYRFYEPAPYRAYENVPGGDLTELLLSTYDGPTTVPLRPVVVLTDEEVQQARSWWAQLPSDRPRILVETEFYSQQSPWTVEYAREMIETLRPLRPVFVFTAKNRPPYLDELAADYPDLVWCDVPFRLNAELYNLCDAFIGVSSAISCLSNATWCREDVPHIEVVSGPHWSTWHFRHHTRRRICFDRIKFKHALTWLADTLSGSHPSSSPVPNESLLALYTHRQEGKYHWLSPALLPSASSVASQQDALRAITRVLEDIGPFYLCYGGIGDFLLALSTALDQTNTNHEPITVVAYPNSVPAATAFFDALPAVTNVYFIERHADPTDQYIAGMFLRAATWSLPNCRGRGVTPPAREDDFWKPGLDIVRSCGVTLYPEWVRRYVSERLEQPQVVLAPMGSVYGMFRSKRNIIAPQYWDALLALLRACGIRPIVIGTPDEADAYPIDQRARDERSYCFEDQFRILASADLVIAADSWHKTFAAMAGVPTIVFEPLKNHDLAFWLDSSHAAFIHPWKNIQLVRSWNEARRAIIDALESHCGIKLGSLTIHVRNPIEHPRRTNPEQPLTSLHPVFWERPYQQAHHVLVRLPDAVGDTLMMTAVTSALVSAYPHLELTIAGAPFATDIFRHHPNIRQCVRTHSSSDLRAEASADVVVDYRFLIDQLPEYYGILPMMDVLANIAGIRLPSKQIVYHVEQDELDWAAALVPQEYPVLALHLSTAKDPYRSYPHGSELLSALLEQIPDVQLLWLGSTPAPLRNERIIDCARREYSLRQQIALVGRASAAVVIDSAFYHVAHNRWQKPTLLLAGPTSEYLIGNYASAPLFTIRSSMCSACYWNAERCKRTCLASLDPRMVARAAAQFLDRVCSKSLRPLPLPKRTLLRCPWDRLQRHYAAACMHHRTSGNGPVEIVITPGDPLPDYASQWNGITIDEHTHKSAVSLSEVFHS